jgi:hypothetical protein
VLLLLGCGDRTGLDVAAAASVGDADTTPEADGPAQAPVFCSRTTGQVDAGGPGVTQCPPGDLCAGQTNPVAFYCCDPTVCR